MANRVVCYDNDEPCMNHIAKLLKLSQKPPSPIMANKVIHRTIEFEMHALLHLVHEYLK